MAVHNGVDKKEILDFLNSLDRQTALLAIEDLFRFIQAWGAECGPTDDMLQVLCHKLLIDKAVAEIYLRCPILIPMMEPMRGGQSLTQVKCALLMTKEGRQWWHALLVMKALYKCDGRIAHSRLLRWLGHRANRDEIRNALDKLRDAGILEIYFIEGADSLRPVTWYRLRQYATEHCKTEFS